MRHRPRDRPHPARAQRPVRAAGPAVCALAAAGAAVAAGAAMASPGTPARPAPTAPTAQTGSPVATVVVHDPVDTAGGFDLTRVQVGRASDGRMRAALTLAAPWRMRDLPADDGPPGSLCLRMWTVTKGEAAFPDRLLCIPRTRGPSTCAARSSSSAAARSSASRARASPAPATARWSPGSRSRRSAAPFAYGSRPRRRRRGARAPRAQHGAERAGGRRADVAFDLIRTRSAAASGETRPIRPSNSN